jgi:flagellin
MCEPESTIISNIIKDNKMSLTISNNGAVSAASMQLGKNQTKLQESIQRLSSGKKFVGAGGGDPGSLSVAMRLNASLSRLDGAAGSIGNAISFLEYQDGVLETVANIVGRMSELKGLSVSDPLKSSDDLESYVTEFADLQDQLKTLTEAKINGVNVFSTDADLVFNKGTTDTWDTTTIYTSAEGTEGTSVDIHKSLLLSALSVDANGNAGVTYDDEGGSNRTANAQKDFAVANTGVQAVNDLSLVGLDQINGALDNVIWLRGQTAAGLSRLKFAQESVATEKINMGSALGRIEDADIAEESAKLAKYSILMQASAAMIAQANQQSQVALTLLR